MVCTGLKKTSRRDGIPDRPILQVGERRIVFAYALIALGLNFVAWFVPTIVAGAVATSFIGLCLGESVVFTRMHTTSDPDRPGPMFPIMLSVARHSIPHEIAGGSVAWIQRYA